MLCRMYKISQAKIYGCANYNKNLRWDFGATTIIELKQKLFSGRALKGKNEHIN